MEKKEFWIIPKFSCYVPSVYDYNPENLETIHVIEFSAYENALAEVESWKQIADRRLELLTDEITRLKSAADKLVAALEKYKGIVPVEPKGFERTVYVADEALYQYRKDTKGE